MTYIPDPIELMESYQEKFVEGDKVRCSRCEATIEPQHVTITDSWGTPWCQACADPLTTKREAR